MEITQDVLTNRFNELDAQLKAAQVKSEKLNEELAATNRKGLEIYGRMQELKQISAFLAKKTAAENVDSMVQRMERAIEKPEATEGAKPVEA